MEINKQLYMEDKVLNHYSRLNDLQKPEITLFNLLKPNLGKINMLDLGVGCGRTSWFFYDKIKSYLGIDYSENMIHRCKHKFLRRKEFKFKVMDVRELNKFKDESFDLVLFSFNGLDCLNNKDRENVLREIYRIIKKSGIFVFSSHNLCSLKQRYKITKIKHLIRNLFFWYYNGNIKSIIQKDYDIINESNIKKGFIHYYIHPDIQVNDLKNLGFGNIQRFSLNTGKEFVNKDLYKDFWIYYLCRKGESNENI